MNARTLLLAGLALAAAVLLLGGGAVVVKKAATKSASSTEQKKIAQLVPEAQAALARMRAAAAAEGIPTFVGETYRSPSDQEKKIAAGLSSTTTAGKGWHTVGRAWHLVPIVDGKPDMDVKREDLLRRLHKIANGLGIKSLAYNPDGSRRHIKTAKGSVWDAHHFELSTGVTYAAAAAQYDRHAKGVA